MSRAFGVLVEEEGVALRGRFLFNADGVCVAQEVQADSVGRNVNEFLRQVEAWQYATKTGEVCPAGWRPGKRLFLFKRGGKWLDMLAIISPLKKS